MAVSPNSAGAVPARARLLAAGRRALREADARLLVTGLTVDQVTSRAELSPQTFHSLYPRRARSGLIGGKEAFIDDLLSSLLDEHDPELMARIEATLAERTTVAGGDPRRLVRDVSRWSFERASGIPETQLRFIAAALGQGRGRAAASVKASYADLRRISEVTVAAMLRGWGASLRQPFTPDKIGVILTALQEGLVLRSRFDPDMVPPDLFGDAVVALFGSVIDPLNRNGHIDDVVAPLAAAAMSEYAQRAGDLPDDPEQAIVDAARVEFGQRGYFLTEPGHIAATAGVDSDTLRQLFPTNVDIVVAALSPVYDGLKRRVAIDVRLLRSPVDTLLRYGRRLAEEVIAERSFFDAMALVISLHTAQGPVNATRVRDELFFPGLITEVIAEGQRTDLIAADLTALDIAIVYTNNILFRCFSRRDESADAVVGFVDRLILRGVIVG